MLVALVAKLRALKFEHVFNIAPERSTEQNKRDEWFFRNVVGTLNITLPLPVTKYTLIPLMEACLAWGRNGSACSESLPLKTHGIGSFICQFRRTSVSWRAEWHVSQASIFAPGCWR